MRLRPYKYSETHVGHRAKRPLLLYDFNQNWNLCKSPLFKFRENMFGVTLLVIRYADGQI